MDFHKVGIADLSILILIAGSFLLALIDPNIRPIFTDLVKVCFVAYVGRSIANSDHCLPPTE